MNKSFLIFTLPLWQTIICLIFAALFFSPIESMPILLISSVLYFVWFVHTKRSLTLKERETSDIPKKNNFRKLGFLTIASFFLWLIVLNSVGFLVYKIYPEAQNISFFSSNVSVTSTLIVVVFLSIYFYIFMLLVYTNLKPKDEIKTITN